MPSSSGTPEASDILLILILHEKFLIVMVHNNYSSSVYNKLMLSAYVISVLVNFSADSYRADVNDTNKKY